MTLKARITEDMKIAMRAKDVARLSTIRLLLAAIKQREVDERRDMTDADVAGIIDKMVKQRRDSITQFEAGKRQDLADLERAEVTVLQAYMPEQMTDAQIDAAIAAAIAAVHAAGAPSGPAGMGKVMAKLKGKLGLGPATVPFFPTLITVEPNVELRWKGGVPGAFVADHRFIIEQLDESTTLLRHHEVFTGAFKPVGPLKAVPDRVHAGFNSALKRRAESTAGR